ncbi:MAG: ABC transporter ATP-binding protein, partial [Candidatus Humimicrobiaceae bacterium]
MHLEVNNLNYSYNNYSFLEEISFSLGKGEILSIVGPNGSGKTTILKCINKILKLKQGTISLSGENIKNLSLKEISKHISFVPQNFSPAFTMSVFEMVLLGRKPYIKWFVSNSDEEIVTNTLDMMELSNLSLRFFNELSGGEKQKVLIAKA